MLLAALVAGIAVAASMIAPTLLRRAVPFFLYHPERLSAARSSPSDWGLGRGSEVWMESADGVRLHGWWVPGAEERASESCGAVVFFHGNAGHLAHRAKIADRFSRRGVDVLLVDYRGYGRSRGRPDEEGLYRDGMAAYRYVVERRGTAPARVAVAGHSLGGAVAVAVASRARVGGLVVTAAFTSLPDIARDLYPLLPGSWFDWEPEPFPTLHRMREVHAPVLVGRGRRDGLIPRTHVRALFEAAPGPRRWTEAERAGHNDLWSDAQFWRELDRFLKDVLGCDDPKTSAP